MGLKASDLIGKQKLYELIAEGKSKQDIAKYVKEQLTPVYDAFGKDASHAMLTAGLSLDKVIGYTDTYTKEKSLYLKKQEEQKKAELIKQKTEHNKKILGGNSFVAGLTRGWVGNVSKYETLFRKYFGLETNYDAIGALNAIDELSEERKKRNLDPKDFEAYKRAEQKFSDANGTWDTIKAGTNMLWETAKNPAGWDVVGGGIEMLTDPINQISAGAGGLASKGVTKALTKGAGTGTRYAAAATAGAATDAALGGITEQQVAKARGFSDEDADKAGIVATAAGAGFGTGFGLAGALRQSYKAKATATTPEAPSTPTDQAPSTAKPTEPKPTEPKPKEGEFALMSEEAIRDEIGATPKESTPDLSEIEDLKLLKLEEAEQHAALREQISTKIADEIVDPAQRTALITEKMPPTAAEEYYTEVVNGQPVSPRLTGAEARKALEKSIMGRQIAPDRAKTPEQMAATLRAEGFTPEHTAAIVEAYTRGDISIYDRYATEQMEKHIKEPTNDNRGDTPRAGRSDAAATEAGAGDGTAGTRETAQTNDTQGTVPDTRRADSTVPQEPGPGTGDHGAQDGLPQSYAEMARPQAADVDGGDVSRPEIQRVVSGEKSVPDGARAAIAASVANRARSLTGNRYVWGGASLERGADCSGFVQSIHAEQGIRLPRTAWAQAQSKLGSTVEFQNLKVGDTVYFRPSATGKKYAPVTHTGIITGFTKDGRPIMTHAKSSRSGTVTEVMSQGYINRFYTAKRFTDAWDGKTRPVPQGHTLPDTHQDELRVLEHEREDADAWDATESEATKRQKAPEDELPSDEYARMSREKDPRSARRDEIEAEQVLRDSMTDGRLKRYGDGWELRSYPNRVKKIEAIMDNPRANIKHTLSYVHDANIKRAIGMSDDSTLKRIINSSDVRHILKKHGNTKTEKARGLVAVTKDDIANYPDIVGHADVQGIVRMPGGKKRILSAKQVNGHYIVVEEISRKKNHLSLKTMYKKKGKLDPKKLKSEDGKSPDLIVRNASGTKPDDPMPLPKKSIAQSPKAVKTIKMLSDLKSHRYYDTIKEYAITSPQRRAARPKKPSVAALRESLEKRGLDKSDPVYKAEMQKLFKRSKHRSDPLHTYTKEEIARIEKGHINKPLAKKLLEDMRAYDADPYFAGERSMIDEAHTALSSHTEKMKQLEIDEALNISSSEAYREGVDGDGGFGGMRPAFLAVNPLELIFSTTEAINSAKNKLDTIISKSFTSKIKGTKIDDFIRHRLGADMNGFGTMTREQSARITKKYRKLQADLAKRDISAEAKAKAVTDFKKDIREELFDSVSIRYLENPDIREDIAAWNPDLAKELEAVAGSIKESSADLRDRGIILPSQDAKWGDRYLSRIYLPQMVSKQIDISSFDRGIKQAEIKKGRKIESIFDYLGDHPEEVDRLGVVLDADILIKTTLSKSKGMAAIDDFFRGIIDSEDFVLDAYTVKMPEKIANLPQRFSPYYADKVIIPYIDDMVKILERKLDMYTDVSKRDPIRIEISKYDRIIDNIKEQSDIADRNIEHFKNSKDTDMKLLPDDRRYGVIANTPLPKDLAHMIEGNFKMVHEPETFASKLDKYGSAFLAYFKWSKVPANFFSYPRNLQGNFWQWTGSGANPAEFFRAYPSAVLSYLKKDKWYDMAREGGMLNTNVMTEEVNAALKLLAAEVERSGKVADAHRNILNAMQKIGDAYGLVDDFAKIARMRYAVEKHHKSSLNAINIAQDTHYDYSLTTNLVRGMRNTNITEKPMLKILGTLFPTYTQKSIAFIYDTLIHRPATFATIAAGVGIYIKGNGNENIDRVGEEEYNKVMDSLPDYVKENLLARIDMHRKNGKTYVTITDWSFNLPFGGVVNAAYQFLSGHPLKAASGLGLAGSPVQIVGDLKNNVDSFTGKEIYFEYDNVQMSKDIAAYAFKQLAPGTITKIISLNETRHPVIPRIWGVNTYVYEATELSSYAGYKKRKQKLAASKRAFPAKRAIKQAWKRYKDGEITKEEYLDIKTESEKEIDRWKRIGEK